MRHGNIRGKRIGDELMSTKKITALTELAAGPAATDMMPIVDVSDTTDAATGTTKKITATNVAKGVGIGAGTTTAEPVNINTSNGNVAIGQAASSTVELTVAGQTHCSNPTGSTGLTYALRVNNLSTENTGQWGLWVQTAAADAPCIRADPETGGPFLVDGSCNVGVGMTPTANMTGIALEGGALTLKEISTPTADVNYGKVYTKNDNKLYFQDGAGTEHELAFA
jgi:hypothetical protein